MRRLTVLAVAAATCAATAATGAPAATTLKPLKYSGNGNRSLGTVRVVRNAVVKWTNAKGASFSVRDSAGHMKISGKGKRGQTFIARRTYRKVVVRTRGRWTLTITPLPPPR